MAEFYLVLKRGDVLWLCRLFDMVLGFQDLVDALHRGKAFGDIVSCLGKVLQRLYDAVEDHHVIDECRTREGVAVEHEDAAEPQDNDDHHCAEELAHGVGHCLSCVDSHDVVAVVRVDTVEAIVHCLLSAEGLDDTQATQRLLHLAHRVTPQGLCLNAAALQLASHHAHKVAEDGHEDDGEQRELPRDEEQRGEIDDDEDGILEQHVER